MSIRFVSGVRGFVDGWYVDQGEGHIDGPHDSRDDAEAVLEAMEWANAQDS